MPSITARKSSLPQGERPHRAQQHAGHRVVASPRYRPATRPRHAFRAGRAASNGAGVVGDVVDDAAERIDRVHRMPPVGRQHRHAAVEDWCRRARTSVLDRFEVGRRRAERRGTFSHGRTAARRAGWQRHRGLVSFTRVASGSPRRSRRGQPARRGRRITAVSSRSRRSRVRRGRSARHAVQLVALVQQRIEHAAQPRRQAPAARTSSTRAPWCAEQVLRADSSDRGRRRSLPRILQMVQHLQRRAQRVRRLPRWRGPRRAARARAGRPAWRRSGNSPSARPSSRSAAWSRRGGTPPADRSRARGSPRFRPGSPAGGARSGCRRRGGPAARPPWHRAARSCRRRPAPGCRKYRRRCGRRRRRHGYAARSRALISAEPTGKFSSPRSLPDQASTSVAASFMPAFLRRRAASTPRRGPR